MASFRLADSLAGCEGVSYAIVVLPDASGALDSARSRADTLEVSAHLDRIPRATAGHIASAEVNRLQRA